MRLFLRVLLDKMATFSLNLPGFIALLFAGFIVWAHVDDVQQLQRRRVEVDKDVRHAHGILWARGPPIPGMSVGQS